MTKSEKEKQFVDEWKSRIKEAERKRNDAEKVWDRHIGYYKNKMWNTADEKVHKDLATVNLIYPLVSIILETTFNRNPYIYARATRPEFELAAQVIEMLVNQVWYDLRVSKQIRRCIKNCTLMSVGPAELGYSGRYESGQIQPHDMPYVKSTFPKDFIADSTCNTFDDEQSFFRGVKRRVSYDQFKEMYPGAAKGLKPKLQERVHTAGNEVGKDLWPEGIPPWSRVEYWQVQDLLTNRFYVVHPDLDEFADIVENPFSVEGFLSEVLVFNEIPGELWPMSDIVPIEFQQKEINRMRTFMMRHWKKSNDIYIADKAVWTEEDLNKIVNADDVEYVRVGNVDPAAMRLLERGQLSNDFYAHHDAIRMDHREISGISEYYQGGKAAGTKTAYEARQIQQGTAVRLQGHARAVTSFTEDIARKLVQIIKDYWTLPIVSQIAGPKGALYWREFSREEIQAEVDIRVHLGETMPPDEATDRMMAPQFYQLYRQDPLLDQRKVVRTALEKSGIKFDNSWWAPGVEPEPFAPNASGVNQGSNETQGRLRMLSGQM